MDKPEQSKHNVVSMTQHVTHTGYSPMAQVEAYWESLRGNRLMPSRAEIDPRGIEGALEFSFIVERIAPGIARLRIAGSHLNDLMGMEVRGMPLTSFISPGSRRQVSDMLEEVFETPATCTLELQSSESNGAPALEARMLLMPLKSDLGDVSRLLGVLISVGDIGRCPRRFDVEKISLRPIVSDTEAAVPVRRSPVDTAVAPPNKPVPAAAAPGFAEAGAEFRTETPRKDAPWLRLVKTDD